MTQLRCTFATGKALKPAHASAALEALYYCDLMHLIREMDDSLTYWLAANYRKHEAAIVQNSVADELQKIMNKLTVR